MPSLYPEANWGNHFPVGMVCLFRHVLGWVLGCSEGVSAQKKPTSS